MTETALDAIRADLRAHLETEKREVTREIRNYPQPIAGCDAQIPALWERRDGLVGELDRLTEFGRTAKSLRTFVTTSAFMNGTQKQIFIDRLVHATAPSLPSAAE